MNDAMLQDAYRRFDAANSEDPNSIEVDGKPQPKELIFAKRLDRKSVV